MRHGVEKPRLWMMLVKIRFAWMWIECVSFDLDGSKSDGCKLILELMASRLETNPIVPFDE